MAAAGTPASFPALAAERGCKAIILESGEALIGPFVSSVMYYALSTADMALAGIQSRIPVDEVIDAMKAVGRSLPEALRETALGGLAATPTARAFAARL